MSKRLNRRRMLQAMGLGPVALAVACSGASVAFEEDGVDVRVEPTATKEPTPEPTATPEPRFVIPAGEERHLLMSGTSYETPLYVFASGKPGKHYLVLGGVHGNEPGGWLGAERVVDRIRPETGAILVIPRANKVAVNLFERTTDSLGDLNRSYPGFADGLPMERMALEIMNVLRDYHIDLVHDMHESWAFFRDRTTNGTAFIGETIATSSNQGANLVQAVIDRVNPTVLYPHEEFSFRGLGTGGMPVAPSGATPTPTPSVSLPRQQNIPPGGRGTSSLGLGRYAPGVVSILVEMGQQQDLERRIALHVQVFEETMRQAERLL